MGDMDGAVLALSYCIVPSNSVANLIQAPKCAYCSSPGGLSADLFGDHVGVHDLGDFPLPGLPLKVISAVQDI